MRKCCDLNEIYEEIDRPPYLVCRTNQEFATQFFDDLQSTANNELFFRIGLLVNCYYKQQTTEFRLVSGSLQVRMNTSSEWSEQLISADNYCIEDLLRFNNGLPETISVASFCVNEEPTVPDFLPVTSYPEVPDLQSSESTTLEMPKCCPHGYVIEEGTCQPQQPYLSDSERIISNALLFHLLVTHNISSFLVPNTSLSCGYGKAHSLLPPSSDEIGKLKFKTEAERNVSVFLHFLKNKYWDFEKPLRTFCVDFTHFRSSKEYKYYPQVFYCAPSDILVSVHFPILLSISAAALLATFIIYFFVPASGEI